ncbi:MAG: glycosyltransferase [Gemmatimonadota bacterium]
MTRRRVRRSAKGRRARPERGARDSARPLVLHEGDVPFHEMVPPLPRWREAATRLFAATTLLYGVYYVLWRWTSSLNANAMWFSAPLAAAETLALFVTALYVFSVWRLKRREPPPAPRGLDVDVFVTTYNEPLEVIRKTLLGARAIRYPHRTWVLDDGRRDEVRRMAAELGIAYITRDNNEHAKAGNLNHALGKTSGDFILQLDADHVPLPHMLDRLLGYMATDERLAFVQSPQNFYNSDAFDGHLDRSTRRFFGEQTIFFSVILPGKDHWGAAFFCGSCAVIRRDALRDLGGFSTETITEDMETSIRLHARGWKSAYHAEALAYGLAPDTATAFHTQRLRWAQGTMQIWRRFNPLTLPGLTFAQRISYFQCVVGYLEAPARLVFYLAPLIYLFTGILPIHALNLGFLGRFLPMYGAMVALAHLLGRGTSAPYWLLERTIMTKVFTHLLALPAYLTRKSLRFRVTPKGGGGVSLRLYAPHLLLMLASAAAIAWGTAAYRLGWVSYGGSGNGAIAFLINVAWAAWTFALAGSVVQASVASRQRRSEYRFEEALPVRVSGGEPGGAGWLGLGQDLNGSGISVRSTRSVPRGAPLVVSLPLASGPLRVRGRVVFREKLTDAGLTAFQHGVSFEGLGRRERDLIAIHCTQHAVPASRFRFVEIVDLFREFTRTMRDPRRARRQQVMLPARVRLSGEPDSPSALDPSQAAVLEDTSRDGARLTLARELQPGAEIRFEVNDTNLLGAGRVAYCKPLPTAMGSRYLVGVQRIPGVGPWKVLEKRREVSMRRVAMLAGLLIPLRRFSLVGAVLVGGLAATAAPATAQVGHGFVGSVEGVEGGQSLLLAGGWLTRDGNGWAPVGTLIGYRLQVPADPGDIIQWGLNPAVGTKYQWDGAALQATVGYAWQWIDDGLTDVSLVGSQQVTSGVTNTVQLNYWGDGTTSASAISTYSWDDGGYFWSRARAARRVVGGESGVLRLGAEASAQGNDDFKAYELGPALEWAPNRHLAFVAASGWRRSDPAVGESVDQVYARLDIVVLP